MSTSDKIRPASQRRAARRELYGGCRAGARGRRPAVAGAALPCGRCWTAAVHWRSVRPTRAAVRTLLTTVLLCGLRSRIWDRRCGRSGVGSADIGGGPRVIWLGFFADDRRGRCPPCPTAARGGWAAKPNFGRTLRIDCWAAEGVGGWNRREIGFGVDWHRSPLLALRGGAVGGIRILLPNPSNHFQLMDRKVYSRKRSAQNGWTGWAGRARLGVTRHPHTPPTHLTRSSAQARCRLASDGKSTQRAILRAPGECRAL